MVRLSDRFRQYAESLIHGLRTVLIRLGLMQDYPESLLPCVGWNQMLSADDLISHNPNSCIGRRFKGELSDNIETGVDGSSVIKTESLKLDEVSKGLSTSLLNNKFLHDCFKYRQIGEGEREWQGNAVKLAAFTENRDYEIIEDFCAIGWKIENLHGVSVPYTKQFNKEKDFDNFKQNVQKNAEGYSVDKDGKKLNVDEAVRISALLYSELEAEAEKKPHTLKTKASVVVTHMPNNLNYWHFTIDYYSVEDKENSVQGTKGWRKLIAAGVRDILNKTFIPLQSDNYSFGIDYAPLVNV